MRYIDKTDNEPEAFQQWKVQMADLLQKFYNDPKVTSQRLWRILDRQNPLFNKKKLRAHLLQEQAHLCCYCGRRINRYINNTVIDHLLPKSKFKEKTYEYTNLLLSCMGGSRNIIHRLKKGETLESVARDYGLAQNALEQINVSEHQVDVLEASYDLNDLKAGDQLIVILKSSGSRQHCDAKKRDYIIPIHPLKADCSQHFRYNALDGRMKEQNQAAKASIDNLGLNSNPHLLQQRKNVINEAYHKLQELVNLFGTDKEKFNLIRKKMIRQYEEPNQKTGKLPPFAFVTAAVLKQE